MTCKDCFHFNVCDDPSKSDKINFTSVSYANNCKDFCFAFVKSKNEAFKNGYRAVQSENEPVVYIFDPDGKCVRRQFNEKRLTKKELKS